VEPDLQEVIRAKIADGRLPTGRAQRVYAGPGTGDCTACERPVLPGDTEYEFIGADGRLFRYHLRPCYEIWSELVRDAAR